MQKSLVGFLIGMLYFGHSYAHTIQNNIIKKCDDKQQTTIIQSKQSHNTDSGSTKYNYYQISCDNSVLIEQIEIHNSKNSRFCTEIICNTNKDKSQ